MSERHSEFKVVRWTDRIQDILAGQVRGPIRANIDLTNLCGHKCFFCEPVAFREETIRDKRHTLATRQACEAIEDLQELGCRCIQFSGGGEPTLHRDFGPILAHAKRWMRTVVITNGSGIKKWGFYFGTVADHIRISLDASNGAEHAFAHGTDEAEFDEIIADLRAFLKERGTRRTPEVGLAYIVTDLNAYPGSINRVMEMASSLGVDYVQFRPISEENPTTLSMNWIPLSEVIGNIAKAYPSVKTYVTGQRWRDVFGQREFQKCYAALTLAVISANGEVAACCDRRDIVFGNVYEKRFKDIWLSEEHRAKAAQIVPQFCGRCLQCGTNRGIERFVVNNEALVEVL